MSKEYDQKSIRSLEKAVEMAGGQQGLANLINESPYYYGPELRQQHVWKWLNKCYCVPAIYVLGIEWATDGRISRTDLRSDLYPPMMPGYG